jgi:hypothetical protein
MKRRKSIGVACLVLFTSAALSAHHSITAYYDTSRQLTLKGPIAKIEWTNPHAFVHVDVNDEHGATTSWAVETDSPNVLSRGGWTRDTLHIDDIVTVTGYPSKKGTPALRLITLALADGHKLKG